MFILSTLLSKNYYIILFSLFSKLINFADGINTENKFSLASTRNIGNYQPGSMWSHKGGSYNNNTRNSPYIGPRSYILKWSFPTSSSVYSSPAIDANGNVYFGAYDSKLYAVSPSGTLIWSYLTGGEVHSSPAIAYDGSILVGSYDSYFYSISPTGGLNWKYLTGGSILTSPTIGPDGTIYVSSDDSYFYALTPHGFLLWKYLTGGTAHSSAAVGADGTVYFGSHDSYVYALTSSGTYKWSFQAGSTGVSAGIALGSDGTLYFGGQDFNVYAITKDGALKWSYTTGGVIYNSAAIGHDGSVYVGSGDGYLYAFTSLGTVKWSYSTFNTVFSSPLVAADGTIYTCSENSNLYALSSSGTMLWKNLVSSAAFQSSPALAADGTLYVGSMGNELYAIYTSPPTIMPTTSNPTVIPSSQPSFRPTVSPSATPTFTTTIIPSITPSTLPSSTPIYPSVVPNANPSIAPTVTPSINPTIAPTITPSIVPTMTPSVTPSVIPTKNPSNAPSVTTPTLLPITIVASISSSSIPSLSPSMNPSVSPSIAPVASTPSKIPTKVPTKTPTRVPSKVPSFRPSLIPTTVAVTTVPSSTHSVRPSITPVVSSSSEPSSTPMYASAVPTIPSATGSGSASGTDNSSSADTTQLLLIIPPTLAVSFLIAALALAWHCHQRSKRDAEDEVSVDLGWRVKSHGHKIETISLAATDGFAPPIVERRPRQGSNTNSNSPTNSALLSSGSTELTSTPPMIGTSALDMVVPQVPWTELSSSITAAGVASEEELLVGEGSFGSVVRVIWKTRSRFFKASTEREVVVKILKLSALDSKGAAFEQACVRVRREAASMRGAEQHIFTDCIAKVYGVAQGAVPDSVGKILGIRAGTPCVGIVMRYEAGGDLAQYLHCKNRVFRELTLMQKLHILVGITKGIAELHGAGYVHGDIKPGNILLSSDVNPEVRLTDFGLAFMREDVLGNTNTQMFKSTLNLTKNEHARGTPTYSAPEMLFDPVESDDKTTIAKASRKTDVYALAILAWEVMTQKYPFSDIKSKEQLCWCVHQNQRPSLQELPHYTPPQIKNMISNCWSKNRSQRSSASQCYSIASWHYQQLTTTNFDIFFSHPWASKPFLAYVFEELSRRGYRVWYDQHEMGHDLKKSMVNGIKNCKVFLACVNSAYQSRENCMFELEEAKSIPGKIVVTVITEDEPLSWADERMTELCDFQSQMCVNISQHAALDWEAETDALPYRLAKLRKDLEPLMKVLSVNGCVPTFEPKAIENDNKSIGNTGLALLRSSAMIRNLLSMSDR